MKRKKNKLILAIITIVSTVAIFACVAGCAPQEAQPNQSPDTTKETKNDALPDIGDPRFPSEGTWIENLGALSEFLEDSEKDARNAEEQQPRQYVDRFGFTVQPVPADDIGYNLSYLDADMRSCNSCHTLEEACIGLDIGHQVLFHGYPTIQTVDTCRTCHWPLNPKFPYRTDLMESIHTIHNTSKAFDETYNGSCTTCHDIDHEGNFLLWDDVMYERMRGITDVAAEDANLNVSYDQDTLTDTNEMFFKSEKSDPKDWHVDNSEVDKSVYENWTISFTGDIANPVTFTLPELVEKFGTEKHVLKSSCMVNGVGNALAFQAEVEGIPLNKIFEYLQPADSVNTYTAYSSSDDFGNPQPFDYVRDEFGMLVISMNGKPLPPSQGYPVISWMAMSSACEYTKLPDEIRLTTEEEDSKVYNNMKKRPTLGKKHNPDLDEPTWKPNSAVVNYPSGVVLEDQVGKEIVIEGFADANEEPIVKVEFSLDHGETWTELPTPNNDPYRWTYWRVGFTPEEPGAYLLEVRTTSLYQDALGNNAAVKAEDKVGQEHVSLKNSKFMFNVK